MLDLHQHAPLAQVLVLVDFPAVQHRAGRHPRLAERLHHLELGPLPRPLLDHPAQLLACVPRDAARIVAVEQVLAPHHLQQRAPHPTVRHHDPNPVRAPARLAGEQPRRRGLPVPVGRRRIARDVAPRHRHPRVVGHRLLHRQLDPLPHAVALPLPERRQHPDRRLHARARVADGRARLERHPLRRARQRHRAARRLRHHVERLGVRPRPARAETLDGAVDQLRVQLAQRFVAQTQTLHRPQREILHHDVEVGHQPQKNLAPPLRLQIQAQRALVVVQRDEIDGVHSILAAAQPPPRLAPPGRLDLDDLRAQPAQRLG